MPDCEAEEVKAYAPFVFIERVGEVSFCGLQGQSHFSEPAFYHRTRRQERFQVFVQDDEVVGVTDEHGAVTLGEGCSQGSFEAVQGDVGKQWGDNSSLGRACFGRVHFSVLEDARFQPAPKLPVDGRNAAQFGQQGGVVNAVEAFFDVGFQDELGFETDVVEDGFDGVLCAASRPEAVTVGFEAGFPFWFEWQLDQGLLGPVTHSGNTKRSLFVRITCFGDVDAANGGWFGAEGVQVCDQPHSLGGCSVSFGFPKGVCFLGHLSRLGLRLVACSEGGEPQTGYPVPHIHFVQR